MVIEEVNVFSTFHEADPGMSSQLPIAVSSGTGALPFARVFFVWIARKITGVTLGQNDSVTLTDLQNINSELVLFLVYPEWTNFSVGSGKGAQ